MGYVLYIGTGQVGHGHRMIPDAPPRERPPPCRLRRVWGKYESKAGGADEPAHPAQALFERTARKTPTNQFL
jgi:hypothetical protein